jgi:phage pi2 protein 07
MEDKKYVLTEEEKKLIEEELLQPDFDEFKSLDELEVEKLISETQFAKEINKNGDKYLNEINIKNARIKAESEEIITWVLKHSKKKKYYREDFIYYDILDLRKLKSDIEYQNTPIIIRMLGYIFTSK